MKISAHCYALQGLYFLPPWSVNSGFIVGSEQILIIDTWSNRLFADTIYGYATAGRYRVSLFICSSGAVAPQTFLIREPTGLHTCADASIGIGEIRSGFPEPSSLLANTR